MNLDTYLPDVIKYVETLDWSATPGWQAHVPMQVHPLAQGEYNMNYIISQGGNRWVLRVNLASQMGLDDQISYEYRALRLLETSGVTPRPYWLDDRKTTLDHGVLLMEYLPGDSLHYKIDLDSAARLFAHLHQHPIRQEENHLIHEEQPLSMTYEECTRMADVYLCSDFADATIAGYLCEVIDWADTARHKEAFFLSDPWHCIINTEVNSGNFIVNRRRCTLHLVDWEKPLWGDPSQDLSHFSVPTTTLWKTGYFMTPEDKTDFLNAYRQTITDLHLTNTIIERVHLRDPFNCLRGVTWSAMAYVQYQNGDHTLKNLDTFARIQQYLQIGFLRSLFDVYLESKQREDIWR